MIKSYVFTGTHSTGKTTVLDVLENKLNNYNFHKSITRRVKSSGSKINTEASDADQMNIVKAVDDYYKNNENNINTENSIADRCLVDTLAYTMYLNDINQVSDTVVLYCKEILEKYIDRYEHIFYFKTEFELVEDGTRVQDDNFRVQVEKHVENILNDYNLPSTIITGSVDERVDTILNIIDTEKDIYLCNKDELLLSLVDTKINLEFALDQIDYHDTSSKWNYNSRAIVLLEDNTVKGALHFKVDKLSKLCSIYKITEGKNTGTKLINAYSRLMQYRNIDNSMIYINNESIDFYNKIGIEPIGEYKHRPDMQVSYFCNKTLKNSVIKKEDLNVVSSKVKIS